MNASLIKPAKPTIPDGHALCVKEARGGIIIDGPLTMAKILELLDDAVCIEHMEPVRIGYHHVNITEEVADAWLVKHEDITPYDEAVVPEYVKASDAWRVLWSAFSPKPLSSHDQYYANSAGRR